MPKPSQSALIVDDEAGSRHTLREIIQRFCPQLEVCAEAGTVEEALAAIQQFRPAVVFLDIDLHAGTGFEVLDAYPRPDFKVVFVTAHEDFALKAFKYRALHYLLKPLDPQEVIALANELQTSHTNGQELDDLQRALKSTEQGKLLLPTVQGTIIILPDEISYVVAKDKYATVALLSGEKIFVSCSLKDIGDILSPGEFLRPHQSYIVRLDAVRKVVKSEGFTLILKDKTEVPVSRRNREEVLKVLGVT